MTLKAMLKFKIQIWLNGLLVEWLIKELSSLRSQLEYWNNGMVGIDDQSEYNDINYLIIVA